MFKKARSGKFVHDFCTENEVVNLDTARAKFQKLCGKTQNPNTRNMAGIPDCAGQSERMFDIYKFTQVLINDNNDYSARMAELFSQGVENVFQDSVFACKKS